MATFVRERAGRSFDLADQLWFASASGDVNPMHVDPLRARRTQAGAPVVHGIHALLWGLDALSAAGVVPPDANAIVARFQRFVYLDRPVELGVRRRSERTTRAEVRVDGLTAVAIELHCREAQEPWRPVEAPPAIELPDTPLKPAFEELSECRGAFPVPDPAVAERFPHAARSFGAARIAALAQLSTLVGMLCPGLHSIFGDLEVDLVDDDGAGVAFAVRSVDERIRNVEMAVAGAGISGNVNAFVRRPPVEPPSADDLSARVGEREFAGSTALVVGGSRGLGALTSRLLLAGGARVILTYAVGEAEAREVAAGARCAARVVRYDVRETVPAEIVEASAAADCAYYFATPPIAHQATAVFSRPRLDELLHYYVDAFAGMCDALTAGRTRPLSVFYPSTVFIGERPRRMTEYAMAKAAGEVLCQDLQEYRRQLRIVVRRLPRMLTDQTASIVPAESEDGVAVMLPIVRELYRSAVDGA